MRLANHHDRAVIVLGDDALLDIATASDGAYGPQMQSVLEDWDAFSAWAEGAIVTDSFPSDGTNGFGAVVPAPRQVLAVGLNYRLHAEESGLPIPEVPLVFTKFPSSISAPHGAVELPTDQVDWEVEVAVVIGREARRISRESAWGHVAGIATSQDFSARDVQLAGGAKPQFNLGKSFEGFLPIGPYLVTPDEYEDRDDIALECSINGVRVQSSSTADLIFPVDSLVSYLSHIVTLHPGDVILTGTPAGVGLGMTPPRYLVDGDEVVTTVALAGSMRHVARAPEEVFDAAKLLG
jgi:2-keto-4-pentenoate hydratase/2-oxohepta-3-ene-1,7-dioic acid hydratase in catechol pathway